MSSKYLFIQALFCVLQILLPCFLACPWTSPSPSITLNERVVGSDRQLYAGHCAGRYVCPAAVSVLRLAECDLCSDQQPAWALLGHPPHISHTVLPCEKGIHTSVTSFVFCFSTRDEDAEEQQRPCCREIQDQSVSLAISPNLLPSEVPH